MPELWDNIRVDYEEIGGARGLNVRDITEAAKSILLEKPGYPNHAGSFLYDDHWGYNMVPYTRHDDTTIPSP